MNLELFNPEQKEAITLSHDHSKYKNILLIAGAGSGKTRVIVYRITHLIQSCGVSPKQILALTFTKKAAKEMKGRTVGLLGGNLPVKMSTFHSLAADILRNLSDTPVEIIDDTDKNKILTMLIKERDLKETVKLKNFKSWLDYQRNRCINPDVSAFNDGPQDEIYRELARAYRVAKSQIGTGVYDFDDLLEKTVEMLEGNEKLQKSLHHRWRYMMVDEYQDTNNLQFKLLSLLRGDKTQLLQVGDEDQLIYSWRGAEIEHILNSYEESKKAQNTKCIVLNRNYRCSANILELANKVVGVNMNRAGKKLVANKPKGNAVLIKGYDSCHDESLDIANQIARWNAQDIHYGEMAVLFRTNRMARRVESALISEGIPYKLYSGVAMFDTKEAQLLMSLLRFTERPEETFFIREIYSQIKYGLGPASIEKEDRARLNKGVDWIEHLRTEAGLMEKQRISELVNIYDEAKVLLTEGDLRGVAQLWYHKWDLTQFYKEDSREQRDANILEIFDIIETYEHEAKLQGKKPTILSFQEERLLNDTILDGKVEDVVHLMTIHKSKGLEFRAGAIVGVQDGVFPLNPEGYGDEAEEDYRLAYVAITRFKEQLLISRSMFRVGFKDISGYSIILDPHLEKLMEKGVVSCIN